MGTLANLAAATARARGERVAIRILNGVAAVRAALVRPWVSARLQSLIHAPAMVLIGSWLPLLRACARAAARASLAIAWQRCACGLLLGNSLLCGTLGQKVEKFSCGVFG